MMSAVAAVSFPTLGEEEERAAEVSIAFASLDRLR